MTRGSGFGVLATALAVLLAMPAAGAWDGTTVATVPDGAVLGGQVTAVSTGAPVGGACVSVEANGGVYETRTGGDGRWTVTGLPAGAAFVGVNACENPVAGLAAQWWPQAPAPGAAHAVLLQLGRRRTADVALPPAAVVTGRVLEPDGAGVPQACVVAADGNGDPVALDRTDATGRYRLATLPAGEYDVQARDCTPPATLVGATATVRATVGPDAVADLVLASGGAIEGVVRAEHTGSPVDGACVTLWTAPPIVGASEYRGRAISGQDPLGRAWSDPGRFVFDGVTPGRYRVFFGFDFCSPDDGYAEEWFDDVHGPDMYGDDAVTAVLEVSAGTVVRGVDAGLQPTPSTLQVCPWPPAPAFDDGAASVHREGIACAAALGLVQGNGGTFRPAATVTRGQLATMLVRAMAVAGAVPVGDVRDAFDDDDGTVHEPALNELAARGVLGGVAPRRVAPSAAVTRAQLATMLHSAYAHASRLVLRRGPDRWRDDDGNPHEAALDAMGQAGLLGGVTATTVRPGATLRRDQLATTLSRFVDRVLRDGDR